tara:strand:- start:72347 stop:73240 length:894 start_codon:yes stop_codon:yes gene_type:complete
LKFWELMPDSQQFVIDQLSGDPDGDHLEITDVPHDWTSRSGVKGTGQFLKVEKDGQIAVVIASEKKLFKFEEFSDPDQDYIRSVLARSGKEDLVPAKPDAPDSPTGTPPSTPGSPFTPPPGFPTPPTISIPGQPNFPSSPPPGFGAPNPTFPDSSAPSSTNIGGGGSFTTSLPPSIPSPSVPDATSSMPEMSTPDVSNFQPPSHQMPDFPTPNVPTFEEVYSCSQCGKDVTKEATRCPHCNVSFDYVEDEFGNKTNIPGSSSSTSLSGRGLRGVIKLGVFIAIGVGGFFIKLFTGRS